MQIKLNFVFFKNAKNQLLKEYNAVRNTIISLFIKKKNLL